jgi:type VI secretion system secreted protein VgrG
MATPKSNRLMMTEKANETGRSAVVLHTDGDIILAAPHGRIHMQGKLVSKEVGSNSSAGTAAAAPTTKHSSSAGPPQIPANCSFLNKRFRVEGKPSQFKAIRRPATVGKPQKTTFQFPGDSKPEDATAQTITIGGHSVTEIRSVVGPKEKGTVLPSTDTIANALGAVPPTQYGYIKQVIVSPNRSPNDAYWAKTYNMPDFRSEADAGAGGTVHFYPISQNVPMIPDETMIHESGHAFSENIWPTQANWKAWDEAMKKDGRSVSQYADSSNKEDFSESLVMYSLSKGTPCEAIARKLFPNRYKMLDQVLKPKEAITKPKNKARD